MDLFKVLGGQEADFNTNAWKYVTDVLSSSTVKVGTYLIIITAGRTHDRFEVNADRLQVGLKRIPVDILHIDESAEPVIPMIDDSEQTHRSQRGRQQRQQNAE